jgi:immune inhibitor A
MSLTQNIAPVTITFQNTSQGDNLTYNWSFGDGGSSTLASPTHTFQAGAWEVTLTVTNENGSDISSAVIVATQPVASSGGSDANFAGSAGFNQQQDAATSAGAPADIYQFGAAGGPPQ